jgi:hypothetical protein
VITTLLVMLAVQTHQTWRARTRCEAQMRELVAVLDDALVVTRAASNALEGCRQRNRKAALGRCVPAPLNGGSTAPPR